MILDYPLGPEIKKLSKSDGKMRFIQSERQSFGNILWNTDRVNVMTLKYLIILFMIILMHYFVESCSPVHIAFLLHK